MTSHLKMELFSERYEVYASTASIEPISRMQEKVALWLEENSEIEVVSTNMAISPVGGPGNEMMVAT